MADEIAGEKPSDALPPVLSYRGPEIRRPVADFFGPAWPAVKAVTTTVVAVGGFVTFITVTCAPTLGGTRSCRLKWHQPSADIASNDVVPIGDRYGKGR